MTDRKLPAFRSPADQATRDLAHDPARLAAFSELWNQHVNGFTQQAMLGNPWQQTFAANTTNYFNPLDTVIPSSAATQPIQWPALPGRIAYYNQADWGSALDQAAIWQLADYGWYPSASAAGRKTFPNITTDPCSGQPDEKPYGPYGPRGWQDEYCEWNVRRDPATNKILRIDFTCENPEYWYTLWHVSPETVLALYQQTLGQSGITLEDLCLVDAAGAAVIDPSTGRPAYNPLNRWNSGPVGTPAGGGAMHLTATPNTLQTEIGLAAGATIQRTVGNAQPEPLICCAQYGQPHRNSDPHIGQVTNEFVSAAFAVSLADPPGLYIQMPDFSSYKLPPNAPAGAKASDYWTITRGVSSLNDMYGNPLPGNFILHAVFEVPAEQGFTVGDITIGGTGIQYGAQVAETFLMEINATAVPGTVPATQPCVGTPATPLPQPLQMFYTALWNGYYASQEPANPVGVAMSLASNSVIMPPLVRQGQSDLEMTLVCTGVVLGPGGQLPAVTSDHGDGITVQVVALTNDVSYAVPGNSYPSANQALTLRVSVSAQAAPGLRSVTLVNHGQAAGPAAPAFLQVAGAAR